MSDLGEDDAFRPRISSSFPRYASIKTFFQLPMAAPPDDHDVSLFGIPFDGGVSYRPGARFAPTRVREMSSLGRGYSPARRVNWMKKLRVADIGDCPTTAINIDETQRQIEIFADALVRGGKRFVAIGGDHSCTLPLLRAIVSAQGPVNLIHFDAHIDTFPLGHGGSVHHGAFLRKAIEEHLVVPGAGIQIGLRGPLSDESDLILANEAGVRLIDMDVVRDRPIKDLVESLPALPEGPTYLTFDVDCLDPAYAPGTGTPVAGGLTTYEVRRILQGLRVGRLVAADVVEVNPTFDTADITSIAAVDVMSEILCLMAVPEKDGAPS